MRNPASWGRRVQCVCAWTLADLIGRPADKVLVTFKWPRLEGSVTKSCHITGSWTLAAEQKAGVRCNDYTGTLQHDGNIIKQPVNNGGA